MAANLISLERWSFLGRSQSCLSGFPLTTGNTSHKELGARKRTASIWEGLMEVQHESRSLAVPPKALS